MRLWLNSPSWWIDTPEELRQLLTPSTVAVLLVFSLVLFVASLLVVPWVLRRLPPDALERGVAPALGLGQSGTWRLLFRFGRNLLGATLLVCGFAMLVLPGQGLLTIIAALILLEIPGKWKVVRAILGYAPVLHAINRYRTRKRLEPLRSPATPRHTPRDRP